MQLARQRIGHTVRPVPSAARKVAAASTSPGTGTRSSGRPPRQVTQTKIVIALAVLARGASAVTASRAVGFGTVMSGVAVSAVAVSAKVTRPLLGASAPGSGAWAVCPLLPPTQAAEGSGKAARNATGAEGTPPGARANRR